MLQCHVPSRKPNKILKAASKSPKEFGFYVNNAARTLVMPMVLDTSATSKLSLSCAYFLLEIELHSSNFCTFSSIFDFSIKYIRPGDVQNVRLRPTFLAPPGLIRLLQTSHEYRCNIAVRTL